MKKIINNKVYDTSTAKLIVEFGENYGSRDCIEEALYRKRTGEYFLHGSGGAHSKYSRQTDSNSWTGGEDIRPLTYAEARSWAEEHMDADAYADHFGPVSEDDGRTALSISISVSAADAARRAAARAGTSLSAYIEQLISKAAIP